MEEHTAASADVNPALIRPRSGPDPAVVLGEGASGEVESHPAALGWPELGESDARAEAGNAADEVVVEDSTQLVVDAVAEAEAETPAPNRQRTEPTAVTTVWRSGVVVEELGMPPEPERDHGDVLHDELC